MMSEIVARNSNEITLQVTVKLTGSFMDMENAILDGCNEIGNLATVEALQKFDTDGSPIKLGDTKMTVIVKPWSAIFRFTMSRANANILFI